MSMNSFWSTRHRVAGDGGAETRPADPAQARSIGPRRARLRTMTLLAASAVAMIVAAAFAAATIMAALAGWHRKAMLPAGAGGLIALMIAALAFIVARQLLRDERQFRHDIDAQKLHLRTAIENMSQGFLMFDASQRLVICNRRYIDIYGLSLDIVKPGCTFRELMAHRKATGSLAGDVDSLCADLDARLLRKETTSRILETGDGHSFHVLEHPMPDGGWVVTHEDITERRRAERERDRNREFLDTVIENVPETIVVKDLSDFRYLMVNRAGERLFGVSRDQIIGRTDAEIFAKEQADVTLARDLRTLQSSDPLEVGEDQLHTPGNGVRVVTSKRVALAGEDGAPTYLLAVIGDITDRAQADARIAFMAHHDALTGLANRVLFSERIEDACARQRRRGETFAVLMLDLDGFKDVNDSLGHSAGDALLKEMALRLKSSLRETDVLARLGGDEFAIIQASEEHQRNGALALATRILEIVRKPVDLAGTKVSVGTSIGIALAPADGSDPEELLKKADLALYRTKSEGRNGYNFFRPEMTVEADARYRLRNEIRDAIARGEFELHYQPVFDIKSRTPCGAEALVRWHHPVKGPLSPDAFIPLAEESGLIVALGEWILEKACTDAASWPAHIKVAVNLSAAQFRKGGLFEVILGALVESGLAPERLELEITESVLLENEADYRPMLQQLKNLGVSVVLDDFGQGYSSLGYLTRFPVDKIKIDKAFTQGLSKRADCTAVIASVLTLARSLNIVTTAEGVETEEQFTLLRAAGVHLVQGYLFGRPVPASRLDFSATSPNGRQVA
jgi:diguanylate cyclase (GGDEF)-like protein/PAS domain S-box-containing protein